MEGKTGREWGERKEGGEVGEKRRWKRREEERKEMDHRFHFKICKENLQRVISFVDSSGVYITLYFSMY